MIFDLIKDLETILSDILFSGINNIDYTSIDKIEKLSKQFERVSMNNIANLLNELTQSIKNYKTNNNKKEDIKKVSENISKAEFYLRNALSYEE